MDNGLHMGQQQIQLAAQIHHAADRPPEASYIDMLALEQGPCNLLQQIRRDFQQAALDIVQDPAADFFHEIALLEPFFGQPIFGTGSLGILLGFVPFCQLFSKPSFRMKRMTEVSLTPLAWAKEDDVIIPTVSI